MKNIVKLFGSFIIGGFSGIVIPVYDFANKSVNIVNLFILFIIIVTWQLLFEAIAND